MVKIALIIKNQKALDIAKEAKTEIIRKIKEAKIDLIGKVVSQAAEAKANTAEDTVN